MKITHNAPPNPQIIDRTKAPEKSDKAHDKVLHGTDSKGLVARGSVVDISEDAKLMQKAADIAKAAPDVHADKVESLKKMVKEGKYHVDSEAIADRLLQEHLSTDFGKNNL